MFSSCKFNPRKDIMEVEQFGYVDMREAYKTHTINGQLDVDSLDFNDIENPSQIVGRPSDAFDAITMHGQILKAGTIAQSETTSD